MFKYGITAALEPMSPTQAAVLRGDIERIAGTAKDLGYQGLELHLRDPGQYDGARLKAVADRHGLGYLGIATGMEYGKYGLSLTSPDAAVRGAAVKRLCEHVDLGREIGSPVIIGGVRGKVPEAADRAVFEGYLADGLKRLGDYAGKSGVTIYVEALHRYSTNLLNSIVDTADYLDRLAMPALRLHIDTHHMNIEEADMAASVVACGKRVGYVHYSDSNRLYPGGGHIDFQSIQFALVKVGYTGYITIECPPLPSELECARRGIAYMKKL